MFISMQRHVGIVAEYDFLEFIMYILKVTLCMYMQHVNQYNIFQEQKLKSFHFGFSSLWSLVKFSNLTYLYFQDMNNQLNTL